MMLSGALRLAADQGFRSIMVPKAGRPHWHSISDYIADLVGDKGDTDVGECSIGSSMLFTERSGALHLSALDWDLIVPEPWSASGGDAQYVNWLLRLLRISQHKLLEVARCEKPSLSQGHLSMMLQGTRPLSSEVVDSLLALVDRALADMRKTLELIPRARTAAHRNSVETAARSFELWVAAQTALDPSERPSGRRRRTGSDESKSQ